MNKKINQISKIIITSLILMSITTEYAQQQQQQQQQQKTKIQSTKESKKSNNENDIYDFGGSKKDERLEITNISFSRRYTSDGRGEYMEIFFNIINLMDSSIKLKMYILGYYEDDLTKTKHRKWIGYPQWRKRDFEKDTVKVFHFDSIPEIDKTKIDPDKKELYEFPTSKEYFKYITKNANNGIQLELAGIESKNFGAIKSENYNIISEPLKSTVFAKLYAPFGSQNFFFNNFCIVLYDSEKNKIVHRQLYNFKTNMKIH
ncbi:MAG: hypothetical protein OEZ22_00285 [Spirochaetia bacterium]|nr:hypothetical protein [Spirochaetia bacterium]